MPKKRRPVPVLNPALTTGYDPFGNKPLVEASGPSSRTVAYAPPSRDWKPAAPNPGDFTYSARDSGLPHYREQLQQRPQHKRGSNLQFNLNGRQQQTPTSATEAAPTSERFIISSARHHDLRHPGGLRGEDEYYQRRNSRILVDDNLQPLESYPEYQPRTQEEGSVGLLHPDWSPLEYGRNPSQPAAIHSSRFGSSSAEERRSAILHQLHTTARGGLSSPPPARYAPERHYERSRPMQQSARTDTVIPEIYVEGRPAKVRRLVSAARSAERPTLEGQPSGLSSAAIALLRGSTTSGRLHPLPPESRPAGNISKTSSHRIVQTAPTGRPARIPSPAHSSGAPGPASTAPMMRAAKSRSREVGDSSAVATTPSIDEVVVSKSAIRRGDSRLAAIVRGSPSQSTETALVRPDAIDTERAGHDGLPAPPAAVLSVLPARMSPPKAVAAGGVSAGDAIEAQVSAASAASAPASKQSAAHTKQPVVFRAPPPQTRSLQPASRPREIPASQPHTKLVSRALPATGSSGKLSDAPASLSALLRENTSSRGRALGAPVSTQVNSVKSRPAPAAVHRVLPAPFQTALAPVTYAVQRPPALYTARPLTRLVRAPDVPSDPNLVITFDSSDEEGVQPEGQLLSATGALGKAHTGAGALALTPDESLAREMAELRSLIAERERLTAAADFLNSLQLSTPRHALDSTGTFPRSPADAAIPALGVAPVVTSAMAESTEEAPQSGAASPPLDLGSPLSGSADSEGSVSASDGPAAGAATIITTGSGQRDLGSTLNGEGERLVVLPAMGEPLADAQADSLHVVLSSLTPEELQTELAGIQATKESLELRRQLLTRLLREAKDSWMELQPREAAVLRALGLHGAAVAKQPAVAEAEHLPLPAAAPLQLALATAGGSATMQHGAAESAAPAQTAEEAAAANQAASEAGEAMQLRRQLLLKARERRHNQRLAAMLQERGLPLPPDLQHLPPAPQLGTGPQQRLDQMELPLPSLTAGVAMSSGTEPPVLVPEPHTKGDDEDVGAASAGSGLPPEVPSTQQRQIQTSPKPPPGSQLPSGRERPASSVEAQQHNRAASTDTQRIKRDRSPAPSRSHGRIPPRTGSPHAAALPAAKRVRRDRSSNRGERRSLSPPPRRSRPRSPSPPRLRRSRLRTAERRQQARSHSRSPLRATIASTLSSREQEGHGQNAQAPKEMSPRHPASKSVSTLQQSSAKSVTVDPELTSHVLAPSAAARVNGALQFPAREEPVSAAPESSVSVRLLAHLMAAESATAAPLAKSKVMPMLSVARGFTSLVAMSGSGQQDGARAGPVMGVLALHAAAIGVSMAHGEPLTCAPDVVSDQPSPVPQVKGHYQSPLLTFRSYRLNEAFEAVGGAALTSATYAHGLEPHWPLCPFEHAPRGACHNAACGFQMTVDYWLPPALALDDVMKLANRAGGACHPVAATKGADLPQLASAAVASPGVERRILLAPRKQGPAKHQRAVPPAARQAAIDSAVPSYVRALVSIGGESLDGQLQRPSAGSHHVTVCLEAALKLPLAKRQLEKLRKVDSARTGRYYSESKELEPEEDEVALALARSQDTDPCAARLQEAAAIVTKPDLTAVAAVLATDAAALPDEALFSSAADALRLGISQDGPSALPYWHLLLIITAQRARASADPGYVVEARATAAQAVAASPGCYQLWCAALEVPWRWSTHAQWLSRACLAVSTAPPHDGGSAAEEEHAQAVLDLALRLLNLWCIVGKPELAIAWGSALASDAAIITPAEPPTSDAGLNALEGDIKVVAPAARRALLRLLHQRPAEAAVLWLSCAHVAAWQRLPDAVLDRLGFQKQPAALQWAPVPAASSHVKVHALLAAAAGSGAACLHLQSPLQATQPADTAMARGRAAARAALALTVVRWEAATGCQAVLPSPFGASSPPCTHEEAGMQDLLAMVQRTSKAYVWLPPLDTSAATVSEATEVAWAQLTWPYGTAQMLQMAVQRAATPAVAQAIALSAGEPAFDAWQTAVRILNGVKVALEHGGYIAAGGLLPQAAFGPIVAAILAGGGEEGGHKQGTVAVATAALVLAAAALKCPSEKGDSGIDPSRIRSKSLSNRSSSQSMTPSSSKTWSGSRRSSSSSRSRSRSPSSNSSHSSDSSRSSGVQSQQQSASKSENNSSKSNGSSRSRSSGTSSSSGDSKSAGSGTSGSSSSSSSSSGSGSTTTSSNSGGEGSKASSQEPKGLQTSTPAKAQPPASDPAPVVPAAGGLTESKALPSTAAPVSAASEPESGEVSGRVGSPSDSSRSSSSRSGRSSSSSHSSGSGSGTTSISSDSALPGLGQQHSKTSRHGQAGPPRTVTEARAAFTARLLPSLRGRGSKGTEATALEDGEIREMGTAVVDQAAEREECIFAGINLALLEALGQNGAAAMAACDQSLTAAAGVDDALQLRVWSETLSLALGIVTDSIQASVALEAPPSAAVAAASRTLPSAAAAAAKSIPAGWSGWASQAADAATMSGPAARVRSGHAADAALHAAVKRRRERFAGFLALARRFLSWRGAVSEQPLLVSRLHGQTPLDDPVLEGALSPDASGVVEVLLPLLGWLLPAEAVALTEAAFDLLPATPAVARLVLGVMARRPADAAAVAWALPLLRVSLTCSTPRLPPDLALAAVQLAERAGGGAALALAQHASRLQPAAQLLLQKVAQLKKADQLQRATPAAGNTSHTQPSP